MCQLAGMLYVEHHHKFRTILFSLESKNYNKLWIHGNWGRTETGDTVVYISVGNSMHFRRRNVIKNSTAQKHTYPPLGNLLGMQMEMY